jgi:hypothetical protein
MNRSYDASTLQGNLSGVPEAGIASRKVRAFWVEEDAGLGSAKSRALCRG